MKTYTKIEDYEGDLDIQDLATYELANIPLFSLISNSWLQQKCSQYVVRKVLKKHAKFKKLQSDLKAINLALGTI